jgi:MHS family proline/betaine transporter-like MFS transporter
MMTAGVIGLVALFFLKETAGRPLEGSGPMVSSEEEARELVASSRSRARRWVRKKWLSDRRREYEPDTQT